jgi:hypothetical protein
MCLSCFLSKGKELIFVYKKEVSKEFFREEIKKKI